MIHWLSGSLLGLLPAWICWADLAASANNLLPKFIATLYFCFVGEWFAQYIRLVAAGWFVTKQLHP
jgi:hypothetical protein